MTLQQNVDFSKTVFIMRSRSECVNCGSSYLTSYGNECDGCGTELRFSTTGYFYGNEMFNDVKAEIEELFPGLEYVGLAGGLTGCGGDEFCLVPIGPNGELNGR